MTAGWVRAAVLARTAAPRGYYHDSPRLTYSAGNQPKMYVDITYSTQYPVVMAKRNLTIQLDDVIIRRASCGIPVRGPVELAAMVAAMRSDVLAFLEIARFDDLLLPGLIDRTGPLPVCQPLTLTLGVYLQADSGLLQFTSVGSGGGLHIRLADHIEYGDDLRDDPDVEFAAASVGGLYLGASHSVRCTAMRMFTNNESIPEDGVYRAVQMTFDNTYTVFFDPFWIDGIRLGTGNTPDLWLAEDHTPRFQEAFGPLSETTWLPAEPSG